MKKILINEQTLEKYKGLNSKLRNTVCGRYDSGYILRNEVNPKMIYGTVISNEISYITNVNLFTDNIDEEAVINIVRRDDIFKHTKTINVYKLGSLVTSIEI